MTDVNYETHYCEVHTDKETELRCNKCDRYMCVACAVQTPVGYKCKECVRSQEDRFFTATQNDVVIIAAICGGLSLIAGFILGMLSGLFFFGLILGFPAGGAIAEAAMRAVDNRRARNTAQIGVATLVIGTLIGAAIHGYFSYPDEFRQLVDVYKANNRPVPSDIQLSNYMIQEALTFGTLVYMGLASMAVYARMK